MKMLPIIGMIISSILFVGFLTWYYIIYDGKVDNGKVNNTPSQIDLVKNPTDPPVGYTIEYNTVTKKYRYCFPGRFYCTGGNYNSHIEAIKEAWSMFYFKRDYKPEEEPYDPSKDEANWRRLKDDKM